MRYPIRATELKTIGTGAGRTAEVTFHAYPDRDTCFSATPELKSKIEQKKREELAWAKGDKCWFDHGGLLASMTARVVQDT